LDFTGPHLLLGQASGERSHAQARTRARPLSGGLSEL
jgi:hypothetical protein